MALSSVRESIRLVPLVIGQQDDSPIIPELPGAFWAVVAALWAAVLVLAVTQIWRWIKRSRLRRVAADAPPAQQLEWRAELMSQLLDLVGRDISRSKKIKKLQKRLDWDVGRLSLVLDYLEGRGLVARLTWGADDPNGFTRFVAEVAGGQRVKLTSAGLDEVDRAHIDPASPLQRIAANVAALAPESGTVPKPYDVFISHASEDKDAIVRQLAHALGERGLDVWYDESALRIGDNLRRKIDAGLMSSRFGVGVLSPSFFAKDWPRYELDGLVTREMAGEQQIILPVWHQLSAGEVRAQRPSLANKVALSTSDHSFDEIADQIAEVIVDGGRPPRR